MDISVKSGSRCGAVQAPASKSVAHRLLICAALSREESVIRLNGLSKDIDATARCLTALGADITIKEKEITVRPIQRLPAGQIALYPGESGSTLRFLLPVAGALGAEAVFIMEGRLHERPMDALTDELKRHGMNIRQEGDRLYCSGRLQSGDYSLPGDVSSQFISGLLFALPLLEGKSSFTVTGEMESAAYVEMTKNALRDSGVLIGETENGYTVEGNQTYRAAPETIVEADWSNAAFFLCMGALSHKGVRVIGLNPASAQGDRAIIDILKRFGAQVECQDGAYTVRKGPLKGQTVDARAIPDLVPVIAALSALARGRTRIVNAGRLRLKESDRLQTARQMLSSLGADIAETPDGLIIDGKESLAGGQTPAYGDHRIAMAAAVAACGCRGDVTIEGAQCVEKSYPDFFQHLAALEVEA